MEPISRKCKECKQRKSMNEYKVQGTGRRKICNACREYEKIFKNEIKKHNVQPSKKFTIKFKRPPFNFQEEKSMFEGFFQSFKYVPQKHIEGEDININHFGNDLVNFIFDIETQQNFTIKIEMQMTIIKNDGSTYVKKVNLPELKYNTTDSKNKDELKEEILKIIDEGSDLQMFKGDSGLSKGNAVGFEIMINPNFIASIDVESIKGGRYQGELPQVFEHRGVLNIKNADDKCFYWCVIAHLMKDEIYNINDYNEIMKLSKAKSKNFSFKSKRCVEYYKEHPNFDCYNLNIKSFPVRLIDIPEVEILNNLTFRIYILHENIEEDKSVYSIAKIYESKNARENCISLLLYKEHYMLITNINKFFKVFINNTCKSFVCESCGTSVFTTKQALARHYARCSNSTRKQKYKPPEVKELKFQEYNKLLRVPFKIYADFETYFELITNKDKNTSGVVYQKEHKLMAWGYKVVGMYKEFDFGNVKMMSLIDINNDENLADLFVSNIINELVQLDKIINANLKMTDLTGEELDEFDKSEDCYFCGSPLNGDKVRDHDHITGKYNINIKVSIDALHIIYAILSIQKLLTLCQSTFTISVVMTCIL